MRPGWTRRAVLAGTLAALVPPRRAAADPAGVPLTLGPGAQYGWAALDLATGRRSAGSPELRLPMCSSFKWLLAACVLAGADAGRLRLDRGLAFGPADLLPHSPVTAAALKAAGGGRAQLPMEALCAAAVTVSDNAAANLLLAAIGGPPALTTWLRATGDGVTRLDRTEPELNRVPRGDPRDTTTAAAMLGNLQRLLFGTVLQAASRDRLYAWMLACETGTSRLPAGLPPGWRIAHKTGTWTVEPGHDPDDRAAAGDVGALIPPFGPPILIAAYTAGSERPQEDIEAWFAGVARVITGNSLRERRAAAAPS
jgi:beta-lactamase class A